MDRKNVFIMGGSSGLGLEMVKLSVKGSAGSHEINRSRRDWSRMYLASRLRQRRMTIRSLSEKVNHISASAFCAQIDTGYRYALQNLSALNCPVDSIQQSDQQADFKLLPSRHYGVLLRAGFCRFNLG
jgi:lambda repressor-like predicted transcriptional regulator